MEQFWTDLQEQVFSYYEAIVALLPKLVLSIIVLIAFWYLAGRMKRFSQRRLFVRMDDPLLATFLARIVKLVFILIGFLAFLQIVGLGKATSSLLAGAGISAFIIGFAFKDIGENFLAGILMAFKRPFRIGDIVETGDVKGTIIGLSLRDTQVKTFDGKDVYIPNGQILKNPIINYTIDGFLRQEFTIGLDYGSDVVRAMQLILATLDRIPGILQEEKAPSIVIDSLGSSSLNLSVYYWLDTFDKEIAPFAIKNEAVRQVLQALAEAGFYLPGDIVELKNYNEQKLQTG